nr:MAG: RNA-dependent RNA polymerase [Culex narnavirus 1]
MVLSGTCAQPNPSGVASAIKAVASPAVGTSAKSRKGPVGNTDRNPKSSKSSKSSNVGRKLPQTKTPKPDPLLGQAQRAWDVWRLALFALMPSLQKKGLDVRRTGRAHKNKPVTAQHATQRAIQVLYRWLARSFNRSGPEWTCKQVKEYANYCRSRSLGDGRTDAPRGFPVKGFEAGFIKACIMDPKAGPTALAQLARVGRAMPMGTTRVAVAALRKHRDTLTSATEVPIETRNNLRLWAERWTRDRLAAGGRAVEGTATSFSRAASASVSAANGGQLAELTQLQRFVDHRQQLRDLLLECQGFDLGDADIFLSATCDEGDDLQLLADCAIETARDRCTEGLPIPMVATTVLELGMKARVVTKPPAWAVVAGDACRRSVWPLLESDRRIDLSGARPNTEALDRFHDNLAHSLVGAATPQFFSADLTAATDLMPFDVSWSLWDGLCDGLGATETAPLRLLGRYLLGPVDVGYPTLAMIEEGDRLYQAGEPTDITSVRGCMMGLPLSWTVLNLYNLAVADLACSPAGAVQVGIAPAIARGDDLVAAIPPDEADRYEELIALTGGEANRLKSFRSASAFVLAERTFRVDTQEIPDRVRGLPRGWRWRRVSRFGDPALPPLLTREHQPGLKGQALRNLDGAREVVGIRMSVDLPLRALIAGSASFAGGAAVPTYISLPPAATACLSEFEGTRFYPAVARGLLSVHRTLVNEMRRSAVPLFYPRELGGGGFPHPGGFGAGLASAGLRGLQRAGLALTSHGWAARKKAALLEDPWMPRRQNAQLNRAREQLLASERRAWAQSVLKRGETVASLEAAGLAERAKELKLALATPVPEYERVPRGARIAVPLEDETIRQAARAGLWEDAFLSPTDDDGGRSKTKYPTLGDIARRLKRIREITTKCKFDPRYVPNKDRVGRDSFFEKLRMLRGSETVLVPVDSRPTRVTVWDPARHRADPEDYDDYGYPGRRRLLRALDREEGEDPELVPEPVPLLQRGAGATLGDLVVFRPARRRQRPKSRAGTGAPREKCSRGPPQHP